MNVPYSPQAERSVLGSLMLKNDVYDVISQILEPRYFHNKDYRLVYESIQTLATKGDPFDPVTLTEHLGSHFLPLLGELVNATPSAANAAAYAKLVRDKAIQRQVICLCDELKKKAASGDVGAASLIDAATRGLMMISDTGRSEGPVMARTFMSDVIEKIDERAQNGGSTTGLPSGFTDLDRMTAGFQPGDLIIIAARPSVGKTSLAMNIAQHTAIMGKHSCLVFSLEQPIGQLGERLLSSMANIGLQDIRSGKIKDGAWSELSRVSEILARTSLHIDDTSGLSVSDVRSRARRVSRKDGLDLIIVDYIQLMRGEGQNRTQEVGQISIGLKALAKELKVPVIALSQLNRNLTQRSDKRPVISDLRDSGQIEQDADLVLLIHRDDDHQGVAELNLAKHRNGPTGMVTLTFLGEYCTFGNYAGPAIIIKPLAKRHGSGFNYNQT